MFDVFSDIFACRDNLLTRIDPRSKMIAASALILSTILSSTPFFPGTVFILCTAVMIYLRMPIKLMFLRFFGPLGIAAVIVVLQSFLIGKIPLFSFEFLGKSFTATEEGFLQGVLVASRVLGSVSVVILLGAVTPAYKVFHALRWFRVPEGWIEIALLVYRYIFCLLDQTCDVISAQQVRLGYSNLRRSLSSMGVLAGTVLTRSLDQAMRTHEAMMLRGYKGSIPFGPLPEISVKDGTFALIVTVAAVSLRYFLDGWPK